MIGEESEVEEDEDGNVTSMKVWDKYQLRIESLLKPGWALQHLLKAVLRGNDLKGTFQGTEYLFLKFTEQVSKNNEDTRE